MMKNEKVVWTDCLRRQTLRGSARGVSTPGRSHDGLRAYWRMATLATKLGSEKG